MHPLLLLLTLGRLGRFGRLGVVVARFSVSLLVDLLRVN